MEKCVPPLPLRLGMPLMKRSGVNENARKRRAALVKRSLLWQSRQPRVMPSVEALELLLAAALVEDQEILEEEEASLNRMSSNHIARRQSSWQTALQM